MGAEVVSVTYGTLVLVVSSGPGAVEVLVGVDGSPESRAALVAGTSKAFLGSTAVDGAQSAKVPVLLMGADGTAASEP